jgi:hypothetical protein
MRGQLVQQAPSPQAAGRSWIPTADQLSYTRDLLEVFVLVLALPYLVHELFTSPVGLSERMAGHHSLN